MSSSTASGRKLAGTPLSCRNGEDVAPAKQQLSLHSLRHTFAAIYLEACGVLRDLPDALGHANPPL